MTAIPETVRRVTAAAAQRREPWPGPAFAADYSRDLLVPVGAPGREGIPVPGSPMALTAHGDTLYLTTWSTPLGDGAVHAVPRDGGAPATLATGLRCPTGIAALPGAAGTTVYAATYYGVLHVLPAAGAPHTVDLSGRVDCPNGLAAHGRTLYIADWAAGAVCALDLDRLDEPGLPGLRTIARGLPQPGHLTVDDGALYVTRPGAARALDGAVDRIDPATGERTTVLSGLAFPTGIALRDGTLYIAEVDTGSVLAVDAAAPGVPERVLTGLGTPWGLAA